MELLDGGAFVSAFLIFRVECAISIAVFTMEFLLAHSGATILAQVDRAAFPTGDSNHASFLSRFEKALLE
jgi:hypothetical protein